MTTLSPVLSPATTWSIDASHSLVEFGVRHMMFTTVKGRFSALSGTVVQHADDPRLSSVSVELDVNSITTADAQRDGHLLSPDFFDAARYPVITFTSRRIEGTREAFQLIGDLTIRDTTREVALDVSYNGAGTNPYGKQVAGFTAETTLNRKDFGLNWNVALEAGGVLVGDQIKVTIELQLVKQDAS